MLWYPWGLSRLANLELYIYIYIYIFFFFFLFITILLCTECLAAEAEQEAPIWSNVDSISFFLIYKNQTIDKKFIHCYGRFIYHRMYLFVIAILILFPSFEISYFLIFLDFLKLFLAVNHWFVKFASNCKLFIKEGTNPSIIGLHRIFPPYYHLTVYEKSLERSRHSFIDIS